MAQNTNSPSTTHPFITAPHKTMLRLAFPVLLSMIAEPLTGLVDTAFVAQLGAEALAALGVGTAALSSVFWIFNFLGVGTQTEVAQALGKNEPTQATRFAGLALMLGGLLGLLLFAVGWLVADPVASLLGATAVVHDGAVLYMRIRLFGAPAVLLLLSAFGALRGIQDMRTPLWIAVGVNVLNIGLDALLIQGYGVIPALGIAGAAWASIIAQWVGAVWAVTAVVRKFGWPEQLKLSETRQLLKIGGDLFLRTGMLTFFMLLTTRVATSISVESGAAHQAIRQVWMLTSLGLDALAVTAQSLVGFFIGLNAVAQAKRAAWVSCFWGVILGLLLALGMWLARDWIVALLVPETAVAIFFGAWLMITLIQPVNALAFVTDGVHWGTGDFRYLRNGMFLATAVGSVGLFLIDQNSPNALTWVWFVTTLWITARAVFGVLRIWPGIGQSPFKKPS